MKFPIKRKTDWLIFYSFVFIVLYYLTQYSDWKVKMFTMTFSHYRMSLMNYPGAWGNLFFAGMIMTAFIIMVMVFKKKQLKYIIISASFGILLSVSMLIGFNIHTRLIVGISSNTEPSIVRINSYNNNNHVELTDYTVLDEEFINSAISLQPLDQNSQRELRINSVKEAGENYSVWLSYPEKYGHNYDYILYINGDVIYSNHGNSNPDNRIYYEDNGFLDLLQQIIPLYGS